MAATDGDALICDFAEFYHIYNYRSLPLTYAATLASGLRGDSRIVQKLTGQRVSTDTLLYAAAVDALNLLVWAKSKDGQKNRNRPTSVMDVLTGKTKQSEVQTFATGAQFDAAWERLRNGK